MGAISLVKLTGCSAATQNAARHRTSALNLRSSFIALKYKFRRAGARRMFAFQAWSSPARSSSPIDVIVFKFYHLAMAPPRFLRIFVSLIILTVLLDAALAGESLRVATYNLENYLEAPSGNRPMKSEEAKAKIRESLRV